MALPQQLGIACTGTGKQRILAGGAQVAAQPTQHFVAQEAGKGIHNAMLNRAAVNK
jgi:hypothetical protein